MRKKTNVRLVRHAYVTFDVFNQLQATGGRCSHVCKCKVAPCKHAFTPTQTDIRCSRAACHVHPLELQVRNPQETRRYMIVSPSDIRNVSNPVIIGEYDCSESNKSQMCWVGCAEDFSFGVSL